VIRGVVCFDLDGTLVPNTTTSGHLAALLGHAKDLAVQEGDYAEGKLSNYDVAEFDARWYKGRWPREIHDRLESIPSLTGISEAISELRARGYVSTIGTMAWYFVAEWFRDRYGFAEVCGPDIGRDDAGRFTGQVSRHFDEFDKVAFVESLADKLGVTMDQCVAVGDGRSDIPLFREVGLSIALNGTPAACQVATHSLISCDLRDVLRLIPA
jgi:phosphoserine phosphatase